MDASRLFTTALRLRSPWRSGLRTSRDADGDGQEPHITIGQAAEGSCSVRGVGVAISPVLVDDALEARTYEEARPLVPPPLRHHNLPDLRQRSHITVLLVRRARAASGALDCLLEPTGAGIDDLVVRLRNLVEFRWHTGFKQTPYSGTAPDFSVGPVSYVNRLPSEPGQNPLSGSRLHHFTNRDKPISAVHLSP